MLSVIAFPQWLLCGFSTHDASLGYFNSPAIEGIAIVFMLLAAINFGLHFQSVRLMRKQTSQL